MNPKKRTTMGPMGIRMSRLGRFGSKGMIGDSDFAAFRHKASTNEGSFKTSLKSRRV